MTNPETVFDYFVDANPIPEDDAATATIPPFAEPVPGAIPARPRRSIDRRPRGLAVAVAIFVIVVVIGAGWALLPGLRGDVAPVDTEELLLDDARTAIATFIERRNAGDVQGVLELSPAHVRELPDRRAHEWVAGLAVQHPSRLVECRLEVADETRVTGECDLFVTSPVAVAFGVSRQTSRYTYEDGFVAESQFVDESIGAVMVAYRDYLQMFHPEEYATACRPSSYEPGTIEQSQQMAFTGECAAVVGPLEEDIAAWILDGRPTN